MFRPMKPETAIRRAQARQVRDAERTRDNLRRLREKAAQDPTGIWAELVKDAEARCVVECAECGRKHTTTTPESSTCPRCGSADLLAT